MRRRWGSIPASPEGGKTWAETAVGRLVEDDPRVIDAQRQVAQVREESQGLHARQRSDRDALRMSIYGRTRISGSAATRADEWAKRAEQARHLLARIKALPIDQAAVLVREHAEAQQAAERAARVRESGREPSHLSRDNQRQDRNGIGR